MYLNFVSASKSIFIYALGTVLIKLLGLILFPFYTNQFTIAEYGIIGILEVTTQFLIVFFGLNISSGLFRYYHKQKENDYKNILVFNSIIILSVTGSLMLISFQFFSKTIAHYLLNSENYSNVILLIGLFSFIEIINTVFSSLVRLKEQAIKFTIATLVRFLVSIVCIIYFVKYKDLGIKGIYLGQIIGSVSFSLSLMSFILKNISLKFNLGIIKTLLIFSFPMAIAGITNIVITLTDRYLLKILTNFEEVALYTAGFKIAGILNILVMSIKLGLTPIIYNKVNDADHKRFIAKLLTYITIVFTLIAISLSVFSTDLVRLLKLKSVYLDIHFLVPFLSFAFIIQLLKYLVSIGLNLADKTAIIARITFCIMLLNIGLNIIFIRFFNSNGAAFATMVSTIVNLTLTFYYTQKYFRVPYEVWKIITVLSSGIVFSIVMNLIRFDHFFSKVSITIIFISLTIFVLKRFSFFESIELQRMSELWNKYKNIGNLKKTLKNDK